MIVRCTKNDVSYRKIMYYAISFHYVWRVSSQIHSSEKM